MKLASQDRVLSMAVILSAVVLIILGGLQVRWSRQVSDAARARIGTTLKASMLDWHLDLLREFSGPAIAISTAIDANEPVTHYLEEYQEWTWGAAHPDLVADVFVWQRLNAASSQLLRLNVVTGQVERATWPAKMESLHHLLEDPAQLPAVTQPRAAVPRDMPHANAPNEWLFDPHVPALVHAVGCGAANPGGAAPSNCVMIVLDSQVLEETILPELARRYFGTSEGLDYQVAILGSTPDQSVLYSSDTDFNQNDFGEADARMDVFGARRGAYSKKEPEISLHPEPLMTSVQKGSWRNFAAPVWFDVIRYSPAERDWYLIIKPRRGSLEDIVSSGRRRDLSISFGVLLLLAVSMLMIIVTSHRAQNLARLQMNFISAVSHELRTPLSVMCSAADNLADGVVQGKQQLAQYRSIIASQARQLTDLMEQVLAFAATGQRLHRPHYDLRPLQVAEIIDATLEKTSGVIQDSGFRVEQDIEPNLPAVVGDLPAISQCLQNLIVNAVKYSGASRWIGIAAKLAQDAGKEEVRISIADRGIGIKAAELDRIFQPFFRSPSVVGTRIHGTGLGLSLALNIAQAMNGRITVSSTPGEGSIFTLHLPVIATSLRHNNSSVRVTA